MHTAPLIDALDRFRGVLPALVVGLSDEDARWRPESGGWSIVEIVRHLEDEERSDFRVRLERTLDDPTTEWPPIDPEGWAVERRYNEDELAPALARFDALRGDAVRWLRGLTDPDWAQAREHPVAGPLHAGDLLAAWVAHDALHLRQIAKRMFELAACHGAVLEPIRG